MQANYTRARRAPSLSVLALAAILGSAATATAAGYAPRQLWDGKTPDLRGIWQARDTAWLNIEGHAAVDGVAAASSIVVDPADGKIPYRPEALATRDKNFANRLRLDPHGRCLQAGVPRATYLPSPFQIVQSPDQLAIIYQDSHAFRVMYPDNRPHFEGIDWWMGDSRSHWEGNTLVVDVTTLNDLTWFDAAGNHHTSDMHVVERYSPTGRNTLQYEARIDDARTFTRPWTIRTTLYRVPAKGARILEDECLEDANGIHRRVAPTDPRGLLRNDYRRWKLAPVRAANPGAPTPATAAAAAPTPAAAPGATPAPAAAPASTAATAGASAVIPRLPNGRPDFRGTWYKRGGFGLTGLGAPPGARGGGLLGGGFGRDAATANEFFIRGVKVPYLPEALREKKWRAVNQYLDGEPRCHLAGVPRAAEQPPYPHLIIQDEKLVTILYEYVHEPRIIPLDHSPHPRNYWAWDGDSRAHWEGDTLVVDVSNFNGRTWLDMTGNFVDENLHVVERYTLKNTDTYAYQATLTDPTVFSAPFVISFVVDRQKDAEQILEYGCLEGEGDRQHYTDETGGLQPEAGRGSVASAAAAPASVQILGCLRGEATATGIAYTLESSGPGSVGIAAAAAVADKLPELIDRDVRLTGTWSSDGQGVRRFTAGDALAIAEGCSGDGKRP